jgi:hypothetical protein
LQGRIGGPQHRGMENMTRGMWAARRSGLRAGIVVTGLLACVMCGCREKETSPTSHHAAAPTIEEDWLTMETLQPGKWSAIEAAGELSWHDESRVMRIGTGTDLNGARWTGEMPTVPYVVELEARRMSGSDFFCGLTFPVRSGQDCVSLIVGGWGGSLVGISSIDGMDASENSTGTQHEFENQRWYRIRVQVDEERLQAWIDERQVVDAHTAGQRLSLRPGPIEECAPLGLATWLTRAEVRGAKWRRLAE